MNTEFHRLIGYTRAEIVQIKKSNDALAAKDISIGTGSDHMERMYGEITEILRGLIRTLDDILAVCTSTWNSLMLANIIQAFNLQLFEFKTCRDAYTELQITVLALDTTFVRVCCHIETIMDICKANLMVLCSSTKAGGQHRHSTSSVVTSDPRCDIFNPVKLRRTPKGGSLVNPSTSTNHPTRIPGMNSTLPTPEIDSTPLMPGHNVRAQIVDTTTPGHDRIGTPSNGTTKRRLSVPSKLNPHLNCEINPLVRVRQPHSYEHMTKDTLAQRDRQRWKLSSKSLRSVYDTANDAIRSDVFS
jgi:hypothetical protein